MPQTVMVIIQAYLSGLKVTSYNLMYLNRGWNNDYHSSAQTMLKFPQTDTARSKLCWVTLVLLQIWNINHTVVENEAWIAISNSSSWFMMCTSYTRWKLSAKCHKNHEKNIIPLVLAPKDSSSLLFGFEYHPLTANCSAEKHERNIHVAPPHQSFKFHSFLMKVYITVSSGEACSAGKILWRTEMPQVLSKISWTLQSQH